jgi:hypothetical protein
MGVFVFMPLVLPLTAWPVARLAEQHLHPRTATRLLTAMAAVLALCSTVCLGLVMVVGTAQLPGNPLPDGWSDPEVRAAGPCGGTPGYAAGPTAHWPGCRTRRWPYCRTPCRTRTRCLAVGAWALRWSAEAVGVVVPCVAATAGVMVVPCVAGSAVGLVVCCASVWAVGSVTLCGPALGVGLVVPCAAVSAVSVVMLWGPASAVVTAVLRVVVAVALPVARVRGASW